MKRLFLLYLIFLLAAEVRAESDSLRIYVAPNGNDLATGGLDNPLQSFPQAVKKVKELRKNQPEKTIVVLFGGGTYPLTETVSISAESGGSATAPVIFKGKEKESPVFTGSASLNSWQKVPASVVLKMMGKISGKPVYSIDLKKCGIHDVGDMVGADNRAELYCNGELQTPSRWPNSGFAHTGKALGSKPIGYGLSGSAEGIVEYLYPRIDRWAGEKNVWLHCYPLFEWRDKYYRVSVNPSERRFNFDKPYQEGYKDGMRYYATGLLCELDSATEWFLDKDKGLIYWCPPNGVNPNKAKVSLTVLNVPYMLELSGTKNVMLENLNFIGSRGNGILVKKAENCEIRNCRLEGLGQDGVHLEQGRQVTVKGCILKNLGACGFVMNGGERKTLKEAEYRIDGNDVSLISHYIHTYNPAVLFDGCGVTVTHNHFHEMPSSALRINGNRAYIQYNEVDHVVQESDDQGGLDIYFDLSIRDVVIRYNYWHDIVGGMMAGVAGVRFDDMISGMQVYGNVFQHCGGMFGAVQINGGKDNCIEDNLFLNCAMALSTNAWDDGHWQEDFHSQSMQQRIHELNDIDSPRYRDRWPEINHMSENINYNILRNNLLVNTPVVIRSSDAGQQAILQGNNRQVKTDAETNDPRPFCTQEYLKPLGIKTIPFDEMGLKRE